MLLAPSLREPHQNFTFHLQMFVQNAAMEKQLFVAAAIALLVGVGAQSNPPETVTELEVEYYLGRWYQVSWYRKKEEILHFSSACVLSTRNQRFPAVQPGFLSNFSYGRTTTDSQPSAEFCQISLSLKWNVSWVSGRFSKKNKTLCGQRGKKKTNNNNKNKQKQTPKKSFFNK